MFLPVEKTAQKTVTRQIYVNFMAFQQASINTSFLILLYLTVI